MKKSQLKFSCIKSIYLIICFFLKSNAFSQIIAPLNMPPKVTPGLPGMWPSVVEFNTNQGPTFVEGQIPEINNDGSFVILKEIQLVNSGTDYTEQKHYRYQQTYKGIPVTNAIMAIHVKNGRVTRENGHFIKDFPKYLSTNNILNKEQALQYALNIIKANKYAWQDDLLEKEIKIIKKDPGASYYPKPELMWYSNKKEYLDTSITLAYKLNIFSISPYNNQIIYINAYNGKLLGQQSLICSVDILGKANTAYSGLQNITANDDPNYGYILIENNRNISTYNMESKGNYQKKYFKDDDNIWFDQNDKKRGVPAIDQYAADAHWGSEKVFDYYNNKFNRKGLDGHGYPLLNYVNADLVALNNKQYSNSANAFWDGVKVTFGNGGILNGSTYTPLTALDIIAHEYTHGLTSFSSSLQGGYNESGALNEGFSDIFGTLIEFENKLTANWTIGEDCGPFFRDIKDPTQGQYPNCYKGQYWDPKGEPHQNSTVLSHWFYLLSEGGSGTNDNGYYYALSGIGKDKAAKIAYITNVLHLNPLSDYTETKDESIAVAESLFGKGSKEAVQTKYAWEAVGLSSDPDILSYPPQSICPGSPITVDYSSSITFNKGNIFTLFLSDANGSFKNEKVIGWLASTQNNFSISGIVSSSTPSSKNYRVRIKSSDPKMLYTQGSNSQLNILSNPLPTITSSEASLCIWQEAVLTAPSIDVKSWIWNSGEKTQSIPIKGPGTHSVSASYVNGCQSPYAEIKIPKSANCNIGIYRWWSSEQDQNNNTAIASSTAAIQVYPNPLKNEAIVKATLNQQEVKNLKGNIIISLYEANGKKLAIFNMVKNNNALEGKIRKANLSAGNYYFIISDNQQILRRGKVTIE